MVKAIIFDLNGIFIQSPKLSERFSEDFKVPVPAFLSKLGDIMKKVRMPGASRTFDYWIPALLEWNINFTEKEFFDYWFSKETVSEEIISLARDLRLRGIKIFVLSNNFKERADYYSDYPWMRDAIDKAYFSWQSGFVKPDHRAWQLILEENNFSGQDCLYFDDQQKNVDAAESLGIRSFLFEDTESLKKVVHDIVDGIE